MALSWIRAEGFVVSARIWLGDRYIQQKANPVVSGVQGDRPALFGELLRQHRAAAGFTQEELAERAGLSVRGLRYLERGLHRPYRDTVQRLLEVLPYPRRITDCWWRRPGHGQCPPWPVNIVVVVFRCRRAR